NYSGSIGRSLQFGQTNTIWQKRKGDRLELSSYDLASRTSTVITNFNVFASTVGPVTLDTARHLAVGINFASSTPDTLDVYDVTDLPYPILLDRFSFPTNHQGNANFIGQVVIGPDKVFAVDGNNGIMGFSIIPALTPKLSIVQACSNVTISWTNSVSGWVLQSN